MLTPVIEVLETAGVATSGLQLPALLTVRLPGAVRGPVMEALASGALMAVGKLVTTRGAVAEGARDGNLVASATKEYVWLPDAASAPALSSRLLLIQLKNLPTHFGPRDFLNQFLSNPGTKIQFSVRVEHTYTHKGLRTQEARERRDLDAEYLVREKLLNPSSLTQLLTEKFEALGVQLQLCCQLHNQQAMQQVVTGLELGLHPSPQTLSGGVLKKCKAWAEADKLCQAAELERDKAWAEYSKTYKEEAVRHLVSWAPGEVKGLLQSLLNQSVNINEPLRFL